MNGKYKDKVFEFDGTEEGFLSAAIEAGMPVPRPGQQSSSVELNIDGQTSLICVYWHDWLRHACASHVVSFEPLRSLLRQAAMKYEPLKPLGNVGSCGLFYCPAYHEREEVGFLVKDKGMGREDEFQFVPNTHGIDKGFVHRQGSLEHILRPKRTS